MPRTPTPPTLDARPRRPAWARAAAATVDTVRDLRGTHPSDRAPSGLALEAGPDGRPILTTAPPRRPPARTVAARWSWRNRRTLAPIPVGAGYALLNVAPLDDPRSLVTAALAAPPLAAALWVAILGGRDRTRATLTILAVTLTAMTAWWAAPDTLTPPGGIVAITAAAVAASAHRFRIREDTPAPLAVDAPWQEARWDDLVAAPGAALPGSRAHLIENVYPPDGDDEDDGTDIIEGEILAERLEPAEPAPIGFRLAVELVIGKQEIATLRGKLGVIAGVYGAAKAGTVLDEVGNETHAIVTFTTRRFLTEIRAWRRPTLDLTTGTFIAQTLADGTHGHWQVWIPGQGIRHGWMVGAMGGGKSGAVDLFLANVLSAGIAVADLTDLKGGASIPHWRARALRFGTQQRDAIAALRRAVTLIDYRYWLMSRMPAVDKDGRPVVIDGAPAVGRTWIDPSPEFPIYVVLIEEWTQLVAPGNPLAPAAIALAARTAALGRACLVMFVPTTQPANLDLAFGGNRDLRTNIQAGNVSVLWTDQGSGNLATATRTIDLSRIPQGQPGVGYLVGPGQPRDLQGRGPWVDEPWDAVAAARPGTLGPRETALLDAIDAYSAGATKTDTITAALAARPDDPEWAEIVAAVLGDTLTPDKTAATATATAAGAGDVAWTGALVLGDGPPPETPDGQRRILDLLATGEATAAELRAALGGVSDPGMRKHLNPLLNARRVDRAGHGRYRLLPPTPDPTGDPT
jgi:DNA-binding transcriptional ArsR family regulator